MGIVAERERGFSLMELVTILVLLGILSVTAVSRLNVNPLREASFQQELLSAIRFAQKFALASGCAVQVDVNAATDTYALTLRNDVTAAAASCLTAVSPTFGVPLTNPVAGGAFSGTAPAGTDITAGLTFVYNRQGIPSASGTLVIGGQSIVIEPGTGYARY